MSDKKKKKQKGIMTHPKLGEMRWHCGSWQPTSSVKMKTPLWGEIFVVMPEFAAKDYEQGINSLQEESFEKFDSLLVEQNDAIEQKVLNYFKVSVEEAKARFIPTTVYFGRRGECLLEFQDAEMKEEEYGDDVFLGFTLLLLPGLSLCEDEDAIFAILRDEDVINHVPEFEKDLIQYPWEDDNAEISADAVSEEERQEKEKRFQLKYGQALLKYEEEYAAREKQRQERCDSIEMPKLVDNIHFLMCEAIVLIPLWGVFIFLINHFKIPWKVFLAFSFILGYITIVLLGGLFYEFSDYFLARKDFDAYRDKKVKEQEAKMNDES